MKAVSSNGNGILARGGCFEIIFRNAYDAWLHVHNSGISLHTRQFAVEPRKNAFMLKIPQSGALDLVSLGALVNRLDPGIIPFRKANRLSIHVSGGEFNCAANLADCFQMKTGDRNRDGRLSAGRSDRTNVFVRWV